jgi:hypothetical protein
VTPKKDKLNHSKTHHILRVNTVLGVTYPSSPSIFIARGSKRGPKGLLDPLSEEDKDLLKLSLPKEKLTNTGCQDE